MKRHHQAAAAAVLLLIAAQACAAELWTWTADAPHHHACVRVRAGSAGGTGALIANDGHGHGYVLTAAHVVEGQASASATWWATGDTSSGRIVGRDEANDVAIFEVRPPADAPMLPIAADTPPAGSACELLGFGGPTNRLRHFAGAASRANGGTLELDTALLNGDSGGPVICGGQLVGVIRGGPNAINAGIIDDHGHSWPVVTPAWTTPPGPILRLWQRACPGGYCGPSPSRPNWSGTSPPTAPPSMPPAIVAPTTPTTPPATPPLAPVQPPAAAPDVGAIAEAVLERMASDPRFKPTVTVNVDQVAAALVEQMPAPTIDIEQVAELVLAKLAVDPRFKPPPAVTAEQLADELPPLRFRWTLPDGTQATASARLGQTVVLELPAKQ